MSQLYRPVIDTGNSIHEEAPEDEDDAHAHSEPEIETVSLVIPDESEEELGIDSLPDHDAESTDVRHDEGELEQQQHDRLSSAPASQSEHVTSTRQSDLVDDDDATNADDNDGHELEDTEEVNAASQEQSRSQTPHSQSQRGVQVRTSSNPPSSRGSRASSKSNSMELYAVPEEEEHEHDQTQEQVSKNYERYDMI